MSEVDRHRDGTLSYQNTRLQTASRKATCAFEAPLLDTWGEPEVAISTTVWVEEVQEELPAVEIDDDECEYGSQTWLLHLCHDCGSSGCIKTYRTWYKATVFGELDFFDDGGVLSSCAAATPASATAAPRLSPFRALLPLQLLRLGTLLLILTHHWAMLRCFRLFSNFEISAIFRFWWPAAIVIFRFLMACCHPYSVSHFLPLRLLVRSPFC